MHLINETVLSPQRLVHYRDNWYLDSWCHLRDGLRSFAVDAIKYAEILDKRAKDVSEKRLDEILGSGYGIFSGDKVQVAILRFSSERARWVASEKWHPDQQGKFLEDGSYELKLPYADDRELIMDVLKHGSDCIVVEPPELIQRVVSEARKLLDGYQSIELPPEISLPRVT